MALPCWTPRTPYTCSLAMKLLYGTQLSYYISTIGTLALWEVPRKDFHVMMFHHCATVVLIAFSYMYKWVGTGGQALGLGWTAQG